MTTPALGALLWLGEFPPLRVILLGIFTVFAGYTAVYALNDVVDYQTDREKARQGAFERPQSDLDAVLIRHPMAQGYLSFAEGLIWAVGWAGAAFIGAYLLNPVSMLIFVAAAALEVFYCLMLQVSYLRTLVSGVVKTAGTMAAVYAVDPDPSIFYLAILFLWLFAWEIGGQNVPNDWADLEEDQRFGARTIPVRFGADGAVKIILGCLIASLALSIPLVALSPGNFGALYVTIAVGVGLCLLIFPGLQLFNRPSPERAMALFNRASYYPLSIFIVVVIALSI